MNTDEFAGLGEVDHRHEEGRALDLVSRFTHEASIAASNVPPRQ
jgi:hypothetical protein